ncbi:MAG: S1/P1 nuclease [Prevotellaceae bacterium]|nr:S1/P1 nuclease [Prevotellaceae bacterium]
MKKIAVLLLGISFSMTALGWGRYGHATVAQVAENHLTPKAKKALHKYLDGLPITAIASDADVYIGKWPLDVGFVPTNLDFARGTGWVKDFDTSAPGNMIRYPHCMAVDKDFNALRIDNFNGELFENCIIYIERLYKQLKAGAEGMDPKERHIAICEIVHLLGDMHCPMHIAYYDRDIKRGFFDVTVGGTLKTTLHHYWDDQIFDAFPWSFGDLAHMVDDCSSSEIKAITKGDVYDWAKSAAIESWPSHNVEPNDALSSYYPYEMRPLVFKELRNAGYRLAAMLNDIFR